METTPTKIQDSLHSKDQQQLSMEERFTEKFVGGWDSIPDDSPYLPSIFSFISSEISLAVKEEHDRWAYQSANDHDNKIRKIAEQRGIEKGALKGERNRIIIQIEERVREEVLRDFQEALLTESHITDYADETEYDIMCRFLEKWAKSQGISLTRDEK